MELYCQKTEEGTYEDFFPHINGVIMCGASRKNVIKVKVEETTATTQATHWAYKDLKENEYPFIFELKHHVEMCSPNSFKCEIETGVGAIVPIMITEVD